jgi:NAD(P)-dependent dehydrogenase (short-subunit alcohol dehydrogenase family)
MAGRHEAKVAVVTGASSGIGRVIAERFLAEGARVVVFARREAALREIAARHPEGRVLAVPGDVTRAGDLARLAAETVARFGGVDVVVPNAGIAKAVPFADSTPEAIDEQFRVNLTGAVETVRQFLPHIRQGGAVLFLTTFLTQVGFPGLAIYGAKCTRTSPVGCAPMMERVRSGVRFMRSKNSCVASSSASMLPNSSQWVTSRR